MTVPARAGAGRARGCGSRTSSPARALVRWPDSIASTRPRRSSVVVDSSAIPAPLRKDAARQLAERLAPAAPGHPWEGVHFTSSWGSSGTVDVTLVEPGLDAGIAVDTAQERGAWRHPVRYARLRLDVTVADVPEFGQGGLSAAG
ncbi:hypothetical protein KBP30_01160 [Streptomyces sp. Go40/10]|uniref:hypothetical protein n=1 Tax=Streptomyces sp. Go40/10 TaxID=2825844 RepID=UPI001E5D7BBD|nr:hypothetical protein [Streptomyces sp. Go40/10]UFQ99911.1 hypothetical protein KBP30_01160 [Streptomyces sp. Go40/10]